MKAIQGNLKSTEKKITEYSETKNGVTRTLRVRGVENGFIVEVREDGYKQIKGNKEWYCANQTFISKTNPLEEGEDSEGKKSEIKSKDIDDMVSVKEQISAALKSLKL